MTFVDLTNAFDTACREDLWIKLKFGYPDRFMKIVRQFHEGMMAPVFDDGHVSDANWITNGVKLGCVLAPTFFTNADRCLQGNYHWYSHLIQTDGKLFNLRRLQSVTKVKENVIEDFLFADDCALNATKEQDMQHLTDKFSSAVKTLAILSTQRRRKWCIILSQKIHSKNQTSQWGNGNYESYIISPTSKAHFLTLPTSILRCSSEQSFLALFPPYARHKPTG